MRHLLNATSTTKTCFLLILCSYFFLPKGTTQEQIQTVAYPVFQTNSLSQDYTTLFGLQEATNMGDVWQNEKQLRGSVTGLMLKILNYEPAQGNEIIFYEADLTPYIFYEKPRKKTVAIHFPPQQQLEAFQMKFALHRNGLYKITLCFGEDCLDGLFSKKGRVFLFEAAANESRWSSSKLQASMQMLNVFLLNTNLWTFNSCPYNQSLASINDNSIRLTSQIGILNSINFDVHSIIQSTAEELKVRAKKNGIKKPVNQEDSWIVEMDNGSKDTILLNHGYNPLNGKGLLQFNLKYPKLLKSQAPSTTKKYELNIQYHYYGQWFSLEEIEIRELATRDFVQIEIQDYRNILHCNNFHYMIPDNIGQSYEIGIEDAPNLATASTSNEAFPLEDTTVDVVRSDIMKIWRPEDISTLIVYAFGRFQEHLE